MSEVTKVDPSTIDNKGAKSKGSLADAWITKNAANAVVPGTKSERPGLRNVRRRRSSFSAADVVA
jgi:cell division cycle 14